MKGKDVIGWEYDDGNRPPDSHGSALYFVIIVVDARQPDPSQEEHEINEQDPDAKS